MSNQNSFFTSFANASSLPEAPEEFTHGSKTPHPLCILAVQDLQYYLEHQTEWHHNFGLSPNGNDKPVIGKMFGVLVVATADGKLGYLAAFSGKLSGGNHHPRFVPPVYDSLEEDGFLNKGMAVLTDLGKLIGALELEKPTDHNKVKTLKEQRKLLSISLQQQLFVSYHFLNSKEEAKSLIDLFAATRYKTPPAGAGECAAPKLLQYAFQHKMKPLALTEFWWGQSPKSATWKHGEFYAPCKEKCAPILKHMLDFVQP